MKTENITTKNLVLAAMFAALVFCSIYFVSIPNGHGGFIHFGDAIIFLAASLLPFPLALPVAALGAGLFNLAAPGGIIWLPFTIIIKPLLTLCFTSCHRSLLCPRNLAAPFAAATINTVLYFFANAINFGGFAAATAALPGLLIQGVGSINVYFVMAYALDRLRLKEHVLR